MKRSTDNSRQVAARKDVKIMEADELYNKAKTLLDEAAREWKFYMWSTPQNFHKDNIRDIAMELLKFSSKISITSLIIYQRIEMMLKQ